MRDTNDTSFISAARVGMKALPLAIMLAGMAPMQAMAAGEETCNTDIFVTGVDGPDIFFVGDELILKSAIGADLIRDNDRLGGPGGENPYIDFTGIGYGLDCGGGSNQEGSGCFPVGYPDYPPENRGHNLEFIGVTDSNCRTTDEVTPTDWPTPEADNIVSVPALNGPVRLRYDVESGEGESCSVDMKFRVNDLHESTNWVVQALGVPYYAGEGPEDDMVGRCSNGLQATGYGKTVFYVNTCEISIDKQVSLDGENWSDAASAFDGDDVFYRIVLNNIGTAPLIGDVIVNDEILGVKDVSVDAQGLKPGTSMIIDGGLVKNFDSMATCETESSVTNTAGVEAMCRVGTDEYRAVTDSKEDTAVLSCAPRPPSISLVKSAKPLVYGSLQEIINYSFLVTNNGSVPLTDVDVEDPLAGLSDIDCPKAQLAVSEAMTCTATYSISQADLDAKVVNNTATAYGTAPDTSKVSDQSSAQITTTPRYSLALVKTADPKFYEAVGETISYDYELTNDGNQTLYAPYGVVDNKTTVQCPDVPVSLSPGSSVTCTATYDIQVGDINARSVTNVATGSALNAPGGTPVISNEDDETVVYRGIELTATDMCVNDAPWASYSFDVFGIPGHSPSDVTYTWVNVDDPNNEIVVGGPTKFSTSSGYLLWPGAEVTPNVVPNTPPIGPADPSWPLGTGWPGWELVNGVWIESDVPETPDLVLRVSINPTDEIDVRYPPATPDCIAAPKAVIKVEKSVESVTLVDAGSVDVKYLVTVSNDGGQKGTYDLVDTLMVDEAFTPESVESQVAYVAGTEIVTNGDIKTPAAAEFVGGATLVTGEELEAGLNESFTVTLRFSVNELLLSAEGSNCNPEDDKGGNTGFTNHVDVLVNGEIVDDAEDCDVYPLTPSIEVLKEIKDGEGEAAEWLPADDKASAPVRYYDAGAEYRVIVKNTSLVPLSGVAITDTKLGLDNYPVNNGSLAAGQQVIITKSTSEATAVLDQALVCDESGDFVNTVTANAMGGTNNTAVSDSDVAWLVCVGKPGIEVLKEVSVDGGDNFEDAPISAPAGPVDLGTSVIYRITVTNTGQVDLVDITVDDSKINNGPVSIPDLAIGESYTIPLADWPELDFGSICTVPGTYDNTAEATGTSAEWDSDTDTDTDDAYVKCIGSPEIEIVKEVSIDDGANWFDANEAPYPTAVVDDEAETALYRIRVTNPLGNGVTLYSVVINDQKLGIVDYPIGTMLPGDSVVLVATGYGEVGDTANDDLSQADICDVRGEKYNQATATGESETGKEVPASDSATVDCVDEPRIQIVKTVSDNGIFFYPVVTALAPSDAYYRFAVTNTGNVALENVTVSDEDLLGPGVTIPVGNLAIGETKTISHDASGQVEWSKLKVENFCTEEEEFSFTNTAIAYGESTVSDDWVTDDDTAEYNCELPVNICEDGGKPTNLTLMYNGTPESNNSQVGAYAVPDDAVLPLIASRVEVHGCNKVDPCNDLRGTYYDVPIGSDEVEILGKWGPGGKLLPNITIKIFDGDDLAQSIWFHGSCSQPLVVGDKHGGFTIFDYSY